MGSTGGDLVTIVRVLIYCIILTILRMKRIRKEVNTFFDSFRNKSLLFIRAQFRRCERDAMNAGLLDTGFVG